jgi:hypothetical protein
MRLGIGSCIHFGDKLVGKANRSSNIAAAIAERGGGRRVIVGVGGLLKGLDRNPVDYHKAFVPAFRVIAIAGRVVDSS